MRVLDEPNQACKLAYAQPRNLAPLLYVAPTHLRGPLHAAFPRASWCALAVLDAMLLAEGSIGCACDVARRLGLVSRFELARWLASEKLPPLHELAAWVSVLVWVDVCTRTGTSLCALALRRGRDPAVCYRLVQRVTSLSWSEVRALGVGCVLTRLAARCDAVRDRGSAATARPSTRHEFVPVEEEKATLRRFVSQRGASSRSGASPS